MGLAPIADKTIMDTRKMPSVIHLALAAPLIVEDADPTKLSSAKKYSTPNGARKKLVATAGRHLR